jgi:hypothetical protein
MKQPASHFSSSKKVDRDAATELAIQKYGEKAATVAAHRAVTAQLAGRHADFQFWFDIFQRLVVAGHA